MNSMIKESIFGYFFFEVKDKSGLKSILQLLEKTVEGQQNEKFRRGNSRKV